MSRKRKELPVVENVEIIGVFVPYGAPGDIVDIKIDKKKRNYAEAHI